ncbi:hypothetical protein D9M68_652430 [compost metagenome]
MAQAARCATSSMSRDAKPRSRRCAALQLPGGSGDAGMRRSSQPGMTTAPKTRPSNWYIGSTDTLGASSPAGGTKLASSSTSRAQAVNSARLWRPPGNSSSSPCASASSQRAAITLAPAKSAASASHCSPAVSSSRSARCHSASERARAIGARRVSMVAVNVRRLSSCGLSLRAINAHQACQSRTPSRRRRISSDCTANTSTSAPLLSHSSTWSVAASCAQARKALISVAAARVVDSFQPVSSCVTMPWVLSCALMRRVSARSVATSATGARPSARCWSTQAAASWASSSGSSATCAWAADCGASAGTSRMRIARSPHSAHRACVSGSVWKPSSTISASTWVRAASRSSTSVA